MTQRKKVFLPLKHSLQFWLDVLEQLELEHIPACIQAVVDTHKTLGNTPQSQSESYRTLYELGYSINDIADYFGKSKQYVDIILATKYEPELIEKNVQKRTQLQEYFSYLLYNVLAERLGYDKLREEYHLKSSDYILKTKANKFKEVSTWE